MARRHRKEKDIVLYFRSRKRGILFAGTFSVEILNLCNKLYNLLDKLLADIIMKRTKEIEA